MNATLAFANTCRIWGNEPAHRTADSNRMLVNSYTMYSCRWHYRRMRRAGMSVYAAREVIWGTLFDAMINRPVFVSGQVEVAS